MCFFFQERYPKKELPKTAPATTTPTRSFDIEISTIVLEPRSAAGAALTGAADTTASAGMGSFVIPADCWRESIMSFGSPTEALGDDEEGPAPFNFSPHFMQTATSRGFL